MTYCPNCGAPVEGRYCQKCGTAVSAANVPPAGSPPAGNPYVPPTAPAQGLGMEENLAAALCYIPIIGLIFLIMEPYSKNRTIRFHAWQSIFYAVAWFVIMFALGIVWAMLRIALPYGMWALFSLLSTLVHFALLLGLIMAAVKAYQRSKLVFPIIGPLAEKQANS